VTRTAAAEVLVSVDPAPKLTWPGKPSFGPAPARSVAPAPRADVLQNALIVGDNAEALEALLETHRGTVTLAYLDPPFFTQRAFTTNSGATARGETAFDDHWSSRAEYMEFLARRLMLVRELLAPWGSVVLHVDPKTSHYLRVLCDEIFGEDAFASEIVWRYRRWPSKQENFQRVHDVLLRYRKDPTTKGRWNQLYEPLAASTQKTWGTSKQKAVVNEDGKRARSSKTEDASPGVPLGDVWDISVIAPVAKERTGYPTQKPEALLNRLIDALSDPGDLVLDCFAGSGTTLACAAERQRRFLGVDASPVSVATITRRFAAKGVPLACVPLADLASIPAPPDSTTRLRLGGPGR
jgi:DNA modification methylase